MIVALNRSETGLLDILVARGAECELKADIGLEEPGESIPEAASAKFGVSIRPLNDVEKDAVATLAKSGVKVTRIEPGSFADDVGMVDGDIIVSINREAVNSVDDVLSGRCQEGAERPQAGQLRRVSNSEESDTERAK